MSLLQHLRELKNRLIVSLAAVGVAAICSWFFYEQIFDVLQYPIRAAAENLKQQVQINFEAIASSLDMRVKLSFFAGLLIASPVCIYELWAFVVPALKRREKQRSVLFFVSAFPLFLGGVYSAWLFLPQVIQTLTAFTPEGSLNIISVNTYFAFITRMMLVVGIAFMAPALLVAINAIGLLTGKQLAKSWRVIVFALFLVAAVAAPGSDATTMFYLAVPLLVLYGVALLICSVCDRRRARHGKKMQGNSISATPREKLDAL